MAEPDKRQIGDGSDNYGEAAKQMAKAAKEAGKETAKQAAVKGAEAGANAAAATVQAGVEGGKAVAEIAAGTLRADRGAQFYRRHGPCVIHCLRYLSASVCFSLSLSS